MKRKRWEKREKALFLKKTAELIKQGYTLKESIEFISYHQRTSVRQKLESILGRLRQGIPFHECLEREKFPQDVLSHLLFSESHGHLDFALDLSARTMLARQDVRRRFVRLVRYPLFLFILTFVLSSFIVNYLFPNFLALYRSLEADIPLIMKFLLSFYHAVPFVLVLTMLIFIFFGLFYVFRFRPLSPRQKLLWLVRLPLLKTAVPAICTYQFAVQLSPLLQGGMAVFDCLTVFERQQHITAMAQEATEMKLLLKQGLSLPEIVRDHPLFLNELAYVISHGQAAGNTGEALFTFGNLLFEKLEAQMIKVFAISQPILYAICGLFVLMMFLSILLPVFSLLYAL